MEGPAAALAWQKINLPDGGVPQLGGSSTRVRLRTLKLNMPHARGQWPEDLGGNPLAIPGPIAKKLWQAFVDTGEERQGEDAGVPSCSAPSPGD